VQLDAVLELDDSHGQLEQCEDKRAGLGVGQFGMNPGLSAQSMQQDVSGTSIEQAQMIGQKGGVRGAVAVQVVLDL
jgi:hypothetical protein